MRDNRETERFGLELPAKIEVMQPNVKQRETMDLLTGNVSAGGAFFYTENPLTIGTQVKIELMLPLDKLKKMVGKKACLKIKGKVLRSEEKGMAVCFNKRYKIVPL